MIAPSKKVLSVFIVIIALVVAIIITFGRDKSSTAINYASNLVVGEKLSLPENPNWQNELVVAQNTDLVDAEQATTVAETVTDVMSQSFMANYLALKQSNKLDGTSAQKLIDQTINYVGQSGDQPIKITQLNIIADYGKQSIADYGEILGNIFRNNKTKEAKNELDIIKQAVETRDAEKINELDSIIAVYEKTTDELVKMPVPKTFTKAHLDIVNGANSMILALKEAKTVFSDPIKGLTALQSYQNGATVLIGAIQAVNAFIKQNNIIYKPGSGGYYLLYGK
ncbi:MAG: hypothetical protein V1896_02975 [Candidatus Zambryskibacteria bacterium]